MIDVKRSYVSMTATKIELTMKKAEPMLWAGLELPVSKVQQKQQQDIAEQAWSQEEADIVAISEVVTCCL